MNTLLRLIGLYGAACVLDDHGTCPPDQKPDLILAQIQAIVDGRIDSEAERLQTLADRGIFAESDIDGWVITNGECVLAIIPDSDGYEFSTRLSRLVTFPTLDDAIDAAESL